MNAKFATAWAKTAQENSIFKTISLILAVGTVILGALTTNLNAKPPLVIDRGCYSRAQTGSTKPEPTASEFEGFAEEALSQRFNSNGRSGDDLLSLEEIQAREAEREELKRRGIKQRVILNRITRSGAEILADTDRLLSVGALRSALSFPLKLRVASSDRTASNPYGLILLEVKAMGTGGDGSENHPTQEDKSHGSTQ